MSCTTHRSFLGYSWVDVLNAMFEMRLHVFLYIAAQILAQLLGEPLGNENFQRRLIKDSLITS